MIELKQPEDWDSLKQKAKEEGKGIFLAKLSPACPVSHSVESVIDQWLNQLDEASFVSARIDVIRARNLSRAIASEVGVVHQSPQVLRLDSTGVAQWDADHFDVTADVLSQQFGR